jgi:hypothetical protein
MLNDIPNDVNNMPTAKLLLEHKIVLQRVEISLVEIINKASPDGLEI